jgi:uncharacterized protein YyaL (SSP411 family)
MRLQGSGGWPLTAFCKPDGQPFYAGTYFPPERRHGMPPFRQVLAAAEQAYREQREEVDATARRILDALAQRPAPGSAAPPGTERLIAGVRHLMGSADREHGGFGGAPKFPTPTNLELVLAGREVLPEAEADACQAFLHLTCRKMATRGLWDPLGGGFHRYCVDGHWGVPHFEKMLYDQGLLMRVYADTWRHTESDPDLVWPVLETAAWLRREMLGPEGGFFASQDADSEGVEGKFYAWTPEDVEAVLGAERGRTFCDAYAVSAAGNFEGKSVLWDLALGEHEALASERAALFGARAKRIPPATDRKRVTAWNAFTASGLAYAGSVFDAPELVAEARDVVRFLDEQLRDGDGRRLRVFAEGRAHIPAFLDDFAALLAARLDLLRAGGDGGDLAAALELALEIQARFFEADEGDFFLTPSDGEPLAHRPRSDHDGATPHSAGLAVLGLLRVAALTGRNDLRATADHVLRSHAPFLERAPHAFPTMLRAAHRAEAGLSGAVVVGEAGHAATEALALKARRVLGPDEAVLIVPRQGGFAGLDPSWLSGRQDVARATAYVCHGTTCSLPVTDPADLVPIARADAGPIG